MSAAATATDTIAIRRLLGIGDLTRAQIVAMGPPFAKAITAFEANVAARMTADGEDWTANYYDRAAILLAAGLVLGRDDLTAAGLRQAVNYRDQYLPLGASAHWVQPDGVAVSALMGDDASRSVFVDPRPDGQVDGRYPSAAGQFRSFAGNLTYLDAMANHSLGHATDNRVIARALQAQLLCAEFFPTPFTAAEQQYFAGSPNGLVATDWGTLLEWTDAFSRLQQMPDGSYPKDPQAGADCNYMNAMLLDVKSRKGALRGLRSGLLEEITRGCRFLMTQWVENGANGPGFRYFSRAVTTNEGLQGDGTTPDLTLMHLAPFYFAARFPGNADLLAFADHAFAIGVEHMDLGGLKQFNQAYTSLFRALNWRSQAVAPVPVPVPVPPSTLPAATLRAAVPAIDKVVGVTGRENATIKAALAPVAVYLHALLGATP